MQDQPEDILLPFIITLLTPFFLPITRNIELAERAATQMIRCIQREADTDLIHIAQIIAFGFAAINTLGRAMDETLDSLIMLKLTNSAATLSRCEERKRTALEARPARKPRPNPAAPPATPEEQAEIQADTETQIKKAQTLRKTAERIIMIEQSPDKSARLKAMAGDDHPYTTDVQNLSLVCNYAEVAEDCARDPDTYAGGSQKEANMKAKLLNSCAYDVLCGAPVDAAQLAGLSLTPMKRP